jgi:hypothetical protein
MIIGCGPSREQKLAKIWFDFRELNIPLFIRNNRIETTDDGLGRDIGRLKEHTSKQMRLEIDTEISFRLQRAQRLADQIYALILVPDLPEDERKSAYELDARFDSALNSCETGARNAVTVGAAKQACAAFDAVYDEVQKIGSVINGHHTRRRRSQSNRGAHLEAYRRGACAATSSAQR